MLLSFYYMNKGLLCLIINWLFDMLKMVATYSQLLHIYYSVIRFVANRIPILLLFTCVIIQPLSSLHYLAQQRLLGVHERFDNRQAYAHEQADRVRFDITRWLYCK